MITSSAPQWQPDKELSDCTICAQAFTLLRRRHHCRNCGKLVCDQCSSARLVVKGEYKRVCRKCLADIAINGENATHKYISQASSGEVDSPLADTKNREVEVAKLRKQLQDLVLSEEKSRAEAKKEHDRVRKLELALNDATKFSKDRRNSIEKLRITLSNQEKELEKERAKALKLEKELQSQKTTATTNSPFNPLLSAPPKQTSKTSSIINANTEELKSSRQGKGVVNGRGRGGGKGSGGSSLSIVQVQLKLKDTESEVIKANERAEAAENEIERLKRELIEQKKELDMVKDKLTVSEKQCSGFESRRSVLESEVKRLKTEVSKMKSNMNSTIAAAEEKDEENDGFEECTFSPKLVSKDTYKKSKQSSSFSSPKTSNSTSGGGVSKPSSPRASRNQPLSKSGESGVKSSMKRKSGIGKASPSSSQKEPFDLQKELDKIIGQDMLKQEMLRFEKGVALQVKRQELGIECIDQNPPHMLFRGNPGTGKTSIARLVGKVLKKLGVLKKGHLVEVQRSDLVAGAIGQTALKTREKINEAKGGVLFVDEAYTLAPGSGQLGVSSDNGRDFGREAINELMSVMNDGDPVMIFAGYAKEMEAFVAQNAGLFRRIDVYFDFEDYSPLDIARILRIEINNSGFRIGDNVTDKVLEDLLKKHTTQQQRAAMNGGLSKHVFRKARGHLDASLDLHSELGTDEMCTLQKPHLIAACQDLASYTPTQATAAATTGGRKQEESPVSKSWF